jgi:CDP-diglyceride synthetase
MQTPPDYGQPLYFLTGMTLLAIAGYQMEPLVGMGAVFALAIWALITLYYLVKISKNNLPFGHPTVFFTAFLTVAVTGAYISSHLNSETYMLLFAWLVVVSATISLTRCSAMQKPVFSLLAIQFVGFAFVMPVLLRYNNMELLNICATAKPAVTSANAFSLVLLKDLTNIVVVASLLVAWKMWKVSACCSPNSECCAE